MIYSQFSPAKINLNLKILSLRDDGYHELDTHMAKLDFGDTLTFSEKKEGIELRASGDYKIPTNADNLVYKAADLMRARAKGKKGVKIEIEKKIPLGAGLGGGSSNAATTLKFLNTFWDVNLPEQALMDLGKKLGVDIPFFIQNASQARLGGIGEQVLEVFNNNFSEKKVLLCIPQYISIESAWAYAQLKEFYNQKYPDPQTVNNTFEDPMFSVYPDLKNIKNTLVKSGVEMAALTGSGSVVFAIFSQDQDISNLILDLKEKAKCIECKILT